MTRVMGAESFWAMSSPRTKKIPDHSPKDYASELIRVGLQGNC